MFFNKKSIFNFTGTTTINETTHTVNKSLVLDKNKIIIDGVDMTEDYEKVTIVINGNVESMKVSVCKEINVTGNVHDIEVSGDVKCNDVTGKVNVSQGNVEARNVGGNVENSQGKITCNDVTGNVTNDMGKIEVAGSVKGSVKTSMGNIKIKNGTAD